MNTLYQDFIASEYVLTQKNFFSSQVMSRTSYFWWDNNHAWIVLW